MLGSTLIKSSKRPTLKRVFGRTWDVCRVILPDGRKVDGWLDYTWGRWIHFPADGKWYKTSVDNMGRFKAVDLREEEQSWSDRHGDAPPTGDATNPATGEVRKPKYGLREDDK